MKSHRLHALLVSGAATLLFTPTVDAASRASTKTVTAHGVRYQYRSHGKPGGVPVVLLTRYRANLDDWDPAFLAALSKHRHVITFDQAGVAGSSGKTPNRIAAMAKDCANFIRALGYEKVDVIGWSMGGFTAQALTMDHPDLVRRTVLIGTGPAASEQTPPPKSGVFEVAGRPNRRDGRTSFSDPDRAYLFFADHPYSARMAQASLARIDRARTPTEPVTNPKTIEAQTEAIKEFWFDRRNGYFARLSTIRQPVLIMNGDQDAFFTVRAQAILHEQVPQSQLAIFPVAGHGPQHQHPQLVADTIERFLK